jgi:lactate dehydrogenase-like 2-hydroxyacid dehydrogenase
LLDVLPSLRCVVGTSAGVDHIDLDAYAHRGVAVANAGRIYSADVADQAVGMLIDVLMRVSAAEHFVRRGLWPVQGDYPLGSKVHLFYLFLPSSKFLQESKKNQASRIQCGAYNIYNNSCEPQHSS